MTHKKTQDDEIRRLRTEVAELKRVVDGPEQEQGSAESPRASGRVKRQMHRRRRTVRWDSSARLFGLPAVSIARGPDEATGQLRGHAIGWVAIGDVATGLVAVGGIARGFVAVGGIAVGVFCIGGLALGLAAGVGGFATGYFAVGGITAGVLIVGGLKFPLALP